ncbi:MAG: flagellar hook-associated protein 2, partial [Candidatus Eremiobacteraeota bacterium]|nr:flagellar hook-associated protein 2 [Candidatus Eremiobacteraeota bacterium]
ATATQLTNDAAANGAFDPNATLVNSGASITPSNGPAGSVTGKITIDGVTLQYDVKTQDLNTWINTIANPALAAAGTGASLAYNAGQVTVSSTAPLTLGAAGDSGNMLQVLKLDTAQITFSGGVYSATSTGNIGGINVGAPLNGTGNAGFATAVTAGNFTINGVVFKVDPAANNLNDVLQQINTSSAGVIATYDAGNDRIVLTAKSSGPQGISVGKSGDTSNFLQAAGFLTNYTQPNGLSAGAQLAVGKSAHVQYVDNAGTAHDVYSNSNDVTTAIPGVHLKLQQAVDGVIVPPVTVSVAQDSSGLQSSIASFITSYNAVIDEINTATQAPVIGTTTSASGQSQGQQLTTGGVLFNNQDVLSLKDRLVSMVSGFGATGSTSYNSFGSVGLVLDSSFSVAAASSANAQNTTTQSSVSQQTFSGTSGRLQNLDVSKLAAALSADSNAVAKLFTGTTSIVGQMGAYLTSVSGLPTQLTGSLAGKIPAMSLFRTLTSTTSDQINSLQQQIKLVTDQANLQADRLRAEFVNSESLIASLQSMQSSLGALSTKSTG